MPPKYTGWSMCPALHDKVQAALDAEQLTWAFHDEDDAKCLKSRNTNIIARFECNNKECNKTGWNSGRVAMTIRSYKSSGDNEYNAQIYHQRCTSCKWRADPIIDEDVYVERIVFWLKKWSGKIVIPPSFADKGTPPHISELCEGCTAGRCWVGKMASLDSGISNL